MANLAEYGDKALRGVGDVDHVVAAEAEVGKGVSGVDEFFNVHPDNLVLAAIDGAALRDEAAGVGRWSGRHAGAGEGLKERGLAVKGNEAGLVDRAQDQNVVGGVFGNGDLRGQVLVVGGKRGLNGASGLARTAASDDAFAAALEAVCADLARQVVEDGEGMTVLAEITVSGASDDDQARAIARRIATSPLVKTALFGHDANWGRVLMAAGSAPGLDGRYAELDPDALRLSYNGTMVFDRGRALRVEPDVSGASCTIELDLGLGEGRAGYLTTDLSYDYVRINADYRT